MKNFNKQQLKWLSSFGKNYTERTKKVSIKNFEQKYVEKYGITKSKINNKFYKYFKENDVFFEPGCNIGSQLAILNLSSIRSGAFIIWAGLWLHKRHRLHFC